MADEVNLARHLLASTRAAGPLVGLLALLPDLFQGTDWHNTPASVDRAAQLHPLLGRAWALHRAQDLATHRYTYTPGEHRDPAARWRNALPADSVLLYSGGLDSFIAWRLLGNPPAVYCASGHRAQTRELAMLARVQTAFAADLTIDRTLALGPWEQANGYVPYRNALFLLVASRYAANVVLGQIAEWAPDKNRGFYRRLSALAQEMTTGRFQGLTPTRLRVLTPFARLTKTELVRAYLAAGYDPADLTRYTVSCYGDGALPCGRCGACFSRYVALQNNGVSEPMQQIPDGRAFRARLSWRDLRLDQLATYAKRYREQRAYW